MMANPHIPNKMKETIENSILKPKQEAQKSTEEKLKQSYKDFMYGEIQNNLEKEDNDQTPVQGSAAVKLKYEWGSGMDWHPNNITSSTWMRALAYGDFDFDFELMVNPFDEDLKCLFVTKRKE